MATCLAMGVGAVTVAPQIRCGSNLPKTPRPNLGGKRSTKAKPEPKTGRGFFEQLVEWTQRSSMQETDPVLQEISQEKKASEKKKAVANEKKESEAPPEKKGFFGF